VLSEGAHCAQVSITVTCLHSFRLPRVTPAALLRLTQKAPTARSAALGTKYKTDDAVALGVKDNISTIGDTVTVSTAGLSLSFDMASAKPVSLKNSKGDELLDGSAQQGFYMQNGRNITSFDTVTKPDAPGKPNELLFSVAATGQQIGWAFSGKNSYLTANCTRTKGFELLRDAKGSTSATVGVSFALVGKAPYSIRGIALNYMVYDSTAEGEPGPAGVALHYEAPWENSTWNPPAGFGVYERVDAAAEDETLFDFWVEEGFPHPRVSGAWDRPAAKAWLTNWINKTYDMSNFAMVPHNLSEWREFIPLAKLADAKVLWFNFRAWDYTSIDNVNPQMFPNGVADFKSFSNDAAAQGLRLSTHRMSGGLDPRDPDYCVKPSPGLLAWCNATLAQPVSAGRTSIVVTPAPGTEVQSGKAKQRCSIGDEHFDAKSITPLPSGDWKVELKST